jgi:hypothetical protein
MGFRFQRRLTLFPGVRLNFSRSGISTSIGPRGASVTFGQRGATLNLGIPGTGMSYRQRLGGGEDGQARMPAELPPPLPEVTGSAVASAPVGEVTSVGLESLKQLIKEALAERETARRSVPVAQEELAVAERRLKRAKNWFFGLFIGKQVPQRQAAVEAKAVELKTKEERLAGAVIDAEFTLDAPTVAAFAVLTDAFEQLATSQAIWDVTSEQHEDTRVTRSSAGRNVERQPVRFTLAEDAVLQSDAKVLCLRNANGADLLLYPGFLMMAGRVDIALIELRDIELHFSNVKFTETDPVPSDATVVGHTWAKCNRDGSPDRRFKGNYQIPVVGYGGLVLKTTTGLNEEYLVSNPDEASRFAEAFSEYKRMLRELAARGPVTATPQQKVLEPESHATPAAPTKPAYEWKSLPFLQTSDAVSPEHAVKLFERFIPMLKADVDGFSGARTLAELERFIRTAATAPGVVQAFLTRTPGLERFAPQLTKATADMVRDTVGQALKQLEELDPSTAAQANAVSALKAAREVERALRA